MPWKQPEEDKFVGGTPYYKYQRGNVDIEEFRQRCISLRGQRGERNYLQVKDRLILLRYLYPEAQISTELISDTGDRAVFRATVDCPDGASGTGHGSETKGDFTDYLEKAETKALGRALNAAGIGIQFDYSDFEYEQDPQNRKSFNGVDSPPTIVESGPVKLVPAGQLAGMNRADLLAEVQKESERLGMPTLVKFVQENFPQYGPSVSRTDLTDDDLRTLIIGVRQLS